MPHMANPSIYVVCIELFILGTVSWVTNTWSCSVSSCIIKESNIHLMIICFTEVTNVNMIISNLFGRSIWVIQNWHKFIGQKAIT